MHDGLPAFAAASRKALFALGRSEFGCFNPRNLAKSDDMVTEMVLSSQVVLRALVIDFCRFGH